MKHTRFMHRLEREARLICITGSLPGETPSFDERVVHSGAEQVDKTDKEKPDGKKKESLRDYDTAELLLSSIVDKRNQKIEQAGKDAKKEADAVKTAQDFAAQVKASRMESNVKTVSTTEGKPSIGETLKYEESLATARKEKQDSKIAANDLADTIADPFGTVPKTPVTQIGNEVPQAGQKTSKVETARRGAARENDASNENEEKQKKDVASQQQQTVVAEGAPQVVTKEAVAKSSATVHAEAPLKAANEQQQVRDDAALRSVNEGQARGGTGAMV